MSGRRIGGNTLISLCIPVMNRLSDLAETMPSRVENANSSPPVEIVVLDYGSKDGLSNYMYELMGRSVLVPGSYFTYVWYDKPQYFHSTHAYNLALLSGHGEWVVLNPADVYFRRGYIEALRACIAEGCLWANTDRKRRSTIAFNRAEFIAAGGYDERFESYGPDDVDIIERLERRGSKRGSIPDKLLHDIYTSPEKKIENYRVKGSHQELGKSLMPYLYENRAKRQLVANEGRDWGKF